MENFVFLANSITLLSIVKVLIVVMLGVYTVFAFLMMRMAVSMTRAVQIRDGFVVNYLALAHFLVTVVVFAISIVVL